MIYGEHETYLGSNEKIAAKCAASALPAFQTHGWVYYDGAPDELRLQLAIERLLAEIDRGAKFVGSGRFEVRSETGEYGQKVTSVSLLLHRE